MRAVPPSDYVHGYSAREQARLGDQAETLADLLHDGTRYPAGSRVLEIGCGVGAQTRFLAKNSPGAHFTSIDVSPASIASAQRTIDSLGIRNVRFEVGDLFNLAHPDRSFDHLFVCFVLEHLAKPADALRSLHRLLVDSGTLTVIEGDHSSAIYHPQSNDAQFAIDCLVEAQARAGGDARIGRRLFPLVEEAGFADVSVHPRAVYADPSRPEWVDGFTKKTFNAMVEGARQKCIDLGLCDAARFDRGIHDLDLTAGPGGTFTYLFYKATATKRG
jgi:SAM-dependent methyltransferase